MNTRDLLEKILQRDMVIYFCELKATYYHTAITIYEPNGTVHVAQLQFPNNSPPFGVSVTSLQTRNMPLYMKASVKGSAYLRK